MAKSVALDLRRSVVLTPAAAAAALKGLKALAAKKTAIGQRHKGTDRLVAITAEIDKNALNNKNCTPNPKLLCWCAYFINNIIFL